MILATIPDHATWAQQFQAVVEYHLQPIQPSPAVIAGSVVAVLAGLLMVLRSAKMAQSLVTAFGASLGVWVGYKLALFIGTPGPITCALGAVLLALIAWRWYRIWLAAGSVAALFGLAMLFQLGRGDLQRYLPVPEEFARGLRGEGVQLVSKEQQLKNLQNEATAHLAKIGERVLEEMKNLGPRGWLLPAAAALLGGALAWWGLSLFAVVWMGLLGSILAVLGGSTMFCAYLPDSRAHLAARPEILGFAVLGLWALGLVYQAKEARFPRKRAVATAKSSPKS